MYFYDCGWLVHVSLLLSESSSFRARRLPYSVVAQVRTNKQTNTYISAMLRHSYPLQDVIARHVLEDMLSDRLSKSQCSTARPVTGTL